MVNGTQKPSRENRLVQSFSAVIDLVAQARVRVVAEK